MALIINKPKREISDKEKQTTTAARIRARAQSVYNFLDQQITALKTEVEENPAGLTPEEVRETLGDDAEEFTSFQAKLTAFLPTLVQ